MERLLEFADSLTNEALADMAESFFGERRSIDEEVDVFKAKASLLGELGRRALNRACLLHALLLDARAAPDFYRLIGVKPTRLFAWVDPARGRLFFSPPRGLTATSRYVKTLLTAYHGVQDAFDEYMNGRYYTDRRRGRKRLTMHYKLLRDWAGHINRRIRKVNEGHAPSCVLGFARSMDVAGERRADVAGAAIPGYACALDTDLRMRPLDTNALGVRELPELPPPQAVEDALRHFARRLFKENRPELEAILRRVAARAEDNGESD
ncbi:MAG: hypothetical protein H0S85_10790 [Desulfovibrionaceae bacterium]|jgi:hypothetical protein|nr:hypothetical protein [Desulfovibrionaceae bacterium]